MNSAFSPMFTLVLYRPSGFDDRCREYYASNLDFVVTDSLDEIIETAMRHHIANLERQSNEDMETTLLINGVNEDQVYAAIHEDDRDPYLETFSRFADAIRTKVGEYHARAVERRRQQEAAEAKRKAQAARNAARATETRERKLLQELQAKYGNQ